MPVALDDAAPSEYAARADIDDVEYEIDLV
jgi:hypothetical protein